MLSVVESAERLGVSPARVRALIKAGQLPACKSGRAWVLREEDVLERVAVHPRAGRPSAASRFARGSAHREPTEAGAPNALCRECRALFSHVPTAAMMAQAQSQEEAAFYMAVSDFFLQQRQAQLVKEGVF